MTSTWARLTLGGVVKHRKEFVTIDDFAQYKRCRVQLHAKGIVLRDLVPGSEIKTKEQQVCRVGEFLVAEIDAKVGGFGIVPEALDGAIVSSHYFLFAIDEKRLDRRFLDYFIRTPEFREQVRAQGSTNYAAIRPVHVLGYRIPLPPLAEQRRIVAKIDRLAEKIEEARGLRRRASDESQVAVRAARNVAYLPLRDSCEPEPLKCAAECRLGKMLSTAAKTGMCPGPYLRNANIQNDRIDLSSVYEMDFAADERERFSLKPGDVLINEGGYGVGRCAVWEGQFAPCYFQKSLHRIRVDTSRILPRFLMHHVIWANEQGQFDDITKATTFQHLTGVRLGRYEVHIPNLKHQRRIVAYLDGLQAKVDAIKTLQEKTAAELDALLPSILDKAFKGEL